MFNLFQIYDKFLISFKSFFSKKEQNNLNKEMYLASLSLAIVDHDKDLLDIRCLLPDVKNKSIEEIMVIAERYAEMLTYVNTEKFNKYIDQILQESKTKNSDDFKQTMLIDNIFHFWDIYYNLENKRQYQKYKKDQPLIKPSQAFLVK
jgi:hypothetical protein